MTSRFTESPPTDDHRDLFSRVADGIQTEQDEETLFTLLAEDQQVAAEFQRFMALHAELHWRYVAAALPRTRGVPIDDLADAPRPASRRAWQMIGMALAGGLLAAVSLLGLQPWWRRPATPQAQAATVSRPFATVTSCRAVAAEERPLPAVGTAIAAGRLEIAGGVLELTLCNGVAIVLEGPADIELRDELSAFLHGGTVVIRMPEGMDGFRLGTPATDVIDLGTEFAVHVGVTLATDVQVYDGAVIAADHGGGNARFPQRLVAGQAFRFRADPQGFAEAIPYSESRFVRRIPPDPGIVLPTQRQRTDTAALANQYGRPTREAIEVRRPREPIRIDGRLDEWGHADRFTSRLEGDDGSCAAEGLMLYDDDALYLAAHVRDPYPMRNTIDPRLEAAETRKCSGVSVRLSTDRSMGWPAIGNAPIYFSSRQHEPTADERAASENTRLSHLFLWHHAPSGKACLRLFQGMTFRQPQINPDGYEGAFRLDDDGLGYTLEYAVSWSLLGCADDPPRPGDDLAAVWQVSWGDATGQLLRRSMVDVRSPHEPLRIHVWERAATWGRAEYR
jgi:ferric-dicitrate binding protein FerR (iron transport regulator)